MISQVMLIKKLSGALALFPIESTVVVWIVNNQHEAHPLNPSKYGLQIEGKI